MRATLVHSTHRVYRKGSGYFLSFACMLEGPKADTTSSTSRGPSARRLPLLTHAEQSFCRGDVLPMVRGANTLRPAASGIASQPRSAHVHCRANRSISQEKELSIAYLRGASYATVKSRCQRASCGRSLEQISRFGARILSRIIHSHTAHSVICATAMMRCRLTFLTGTRTIRRARRQIIWWASHL